MAFLRGDLGLWAIGGGALFFFWVKMLTVRLNRVYAGSIEKAESERLLPQALKLGQERRAGKGHV